MLNARHLQKRYDQREGAVEALADVSLQVDEGEFVVVRGPSGCGKTTLLLMLGGLLAPDAGRVTVCDQDLYALGPHLRGAFRASTVGFVFQQFNLVPYLTVRDNVLLPAVARPVGSAETRAEALIARFGLANRAKHVPAELSTGERQRTALARAMLHDPRLVLADEPTGNLDEANAREVLGSLAELTEDNRSVLVVTHDPTVEAFAHRTVYLDAGRLVNRTGTDGALD